MKKLPFLLLIMLVFVVISWNEASSRCCPPPPVLTKPGRIIPSMYRTGIPTTLFTGLPNTLYGQAIPIMEFQWEDWKAQHFGDLLTIYPSLENVQYASPLTLEDVPRLLTLLDYRGIFDKGIHKIAIDSLRDLGKPAVDLLIEIVLEKKQGNSSKTAKYINKYTYRELAIRALSKLAGNEQKAHLYASLLEQRTDPVLAMMPNDAIASVLKDNERRIRFWATMALADTGDPKSIETFSKLLQNDKEKYVRCAAAIGMSQIHEQKAINAMRNEKIARSFYHPRAFLAAGLGVIGTSDPIPELEKALASESGNVRVAALMALAFLIERRYQNGRDYFELFEIYKSAFHTEYDGIVRRSMGLSLFVIAQDEFLVKIHPIMKEFRDPVLHSLFALANAMAGSTERLEDVYTLPAGKSELFDKALAYNDAMIMGLNKTKLINDMLADESNVIRAAAVMMFDKLVPDASLSLIRDLRLEGDPMLCRAVAYTATVNFGLTDFSFCKKLLNSREESINAVALVGLGILNNSDSLYALTSEKPSDPELAKCHMLAMSLMGGFPLFTDLCDFLGDQNEFVRCAAITGVAMLNQPGSLDKILEMIKTEKYHRPRSYAIASLPLVKIPEARKLEVIEALGNIVKNEKHYMPRAYAAMMLSLFHDNRIAFNYTRDALADKHNDVKCMAAISLGLFKSFTSARELRNITVKYLGSPFAQAAFIGLGLIGSKSNASLLVADYEESFPEDELAAISFAVGMSATNETPSAMAESLKNYDGICRKYALLSYGMMRDLDEYARVEAIKILAEYTQFHEKRSKTFIEDMNVQFYNAVIRYSLGKRSAIKDILDTVNASQFVMEREADMDFETLMDPINENFPQWYKMKPFFWSDYE